MGKSKRKAKKSPFIIIIFILIIGICGYLSFNNYTKMSKLKNDNNKKKADIYRMSAFF